MMKSLLQSITKPSVSWFDSTLLSWKDPLTIENFHNLAHPGASGKVDTIIALLREVISVKQTHHRNQQLRSFWERIIKRLENVSLCGYLSLIAINFTMFIYPEVWY
ncbi:unnamed protein product [Strongylus vulgaris]|uniref:Uncharacterized protein n=1 Tax=Strongylus vulgaris TaxID=40348 RepID=A0A3P7L759_STRVU|nr:unnamed protein product [Strongylus vulgaris]